MKTPISDFVKKYAESRAVRLHMPGHKGLGSLGEALDITEIEGADVLYSPSGIIRESEENASALFGTARTVYSTGGSSTSIRAMLYLATLCKNGERAVIAAGRNAHRAFLDGAALIDFDVEWLYGERSDNIVSCRITPEYLDAFLARREVTAVYLTSPDYAGNMLDIAALSEVCHRHGTLLLVDNAHGAYLRFLPLCAHPIDLGADASCDSAHKTLPVLTGGGYLHIGKNAPKIFSEQADRAMALFASTSPSYLILQSLDRANAYLADGYRERLGEFVERVAAMKARLPFETVGSEPLKLTLAPKSYGYTGAEISETLSRTGFVCEFADADLVVMMLTPELSDGALTALEDTLCSIPRREAIKEKAPAAIVGKYVMSPREAIFKVSEEVDVRSAVGRVLAASCISCPPAVPIAVCGELISEETLGLFKYYGIKTVQVIK
ncbi:MAG: PLP-dependent transferase [Clostridia bacterium]|nr:PLP-dependent transferase [Clostridia bacterium]